jgi:hypothetical protein
MNKHSTNGALTMLCHQYNLNLLKLEHKMVVSQDSNIVSVKIRTYNSHLFEGAIRIGVESPESGGCGEPDL